MQHKHLTRKKWGLLTFEEQMANIGSEVLRAENWREKGNAEYARLAFHRALELIDLALAQPLELPRLREITRMRELLVDYFIGENIYGSRASSWQSYFGAFTYAAAIGRT